MKGDYKKKFRSFALKVTKSPSREPVPVLPSLSGAGGTRPACHQWSVMGCVHKSVLTQEKLGM